MTWNDCKVSFVPWSWLNIKVIQGFSSDFPPSHLSALPQQRNFIFQAARGNWSNSSSVCSHCMPARWCSPRWCPSWHSALTEKTFSPKNKVGALKWVEPGKSCRGWTTSREKKKLIGFPWIYTNFRYRRQRATLCSRFVAMKTSF